MSNMVVRTNINSLNAHRKMRGVGIAQSRASQRLSSGFRINSASDDAAGLAISEKMRAQIRGLNQASRNAQDGISLIQTAEGGVSTINDMVIRIRELVIQAANDTYTIEDRQKIQLEIDQILSEIDSVARRTEFNTMPLLDGSFSANFTVTPMPPQNYVLNSGRGSVDSIFNNPTLQGMVLSPSFNFDFFDFWDPMVNPVVLDIDAPPGGTEQVMVDLAWGVLEHDPSFDSFIQNVMFEPDGNISEVNLQHFINTMQAALRSEIAITEDFLGRDLGSAHIIFDVDVDGRVIVGFPDAPFTLTYIGPTGGLDDPNNFNSVFFVNLLNDAGFDAGWNLSDPTNGGINTANRPMTEGDDLPPADGSRRPLWFQIGANSGQGVTLSIEAMHTQALGLRDPNISVVSDSGFEISSEVIRLDGALSHASGQRAMLGAMQNRLEFTVNSLDIASENLSETNSRIRDVDMAKEMMVFTKANVLIQAATSMLAQSNQAPNTLIELLR
ncbi:MAG: hypothetical protein FWC16_03895 [Defluviitaleaceae bacterium]|nr:hypothetical protein [Defluviitaleaceae bacterium]MCL2274047.1 hypothetical protein [Defluviitaleaceae bacterium]